MTKPRKNLAEDESLERLRVMKLDEVKRVTGLSRSTIYLRMETGNFPQSLKLGAPSAAKHAAMAWRAGDIIDWLKALRPSSEQN